jgi:hypothetical protein
MVMDAPPHVMLISNSGRHVYQVHPLCWNHMLARPVN